MKACQSVARVWTTVGVGVGVGVDGGLFLSLNLLIIIWYILQV